MASLNLQAEQLATMLSPTEASGLAQTVAGAAASLAAAASAANANPAAIARYLAMVAAPTYSPYAATGFVAGFAQGFVNGAKVWLTELEALFRLAGIGSMTGLAEFFARPLFEENLQGLLPQTHQALETLNSLRRLKPIFLWLDDVTPAQAVRTLRELVPSAEDMLTIIGRMSGEWLNAQLFTAPDAYASGEHMGRLMGRITLEIIRGTVEPMTFIGIMTAAQLEVDDPDKDIQ